MTDLTAEQRQALDVARNLVNARVPLFVAPPCPPTCTRTDHKPGAGHNNTGFHLPPKWQTCTPTPDVINRWRPGWALCAVMGHAIDLVDVDPRSGGDTSAEGLKQAGAWPRSYAKADSPSGGWHEFIAPLGVGSRDGIAAGIDYKGGRPDGTSRGFSFIAPTVRRSKTTGQLVPYRWTVEPDLDALAEGDDTGEALAEIVRTARGSRNTEPADDNWHNDPDDKHTGPLAYGSRHAALISYAGRLRSLSVSYDEARTLMRRRWHDCAQPPDAQSPLPLEEALDKLRDVWQRYAPGEDPDDDQDTEPDSWEPLDLGPYLRGEIVPAQPLVGLARSDGLRLIYPGKEHAVMGEMESGKTWYALACVAAELGAGQPVVYIHFEEPDPSGTIERLRLLGVAAEDILKLLRFVAPQRQVTRQTLRRLLDPAPSLVVLDGVNEAMALHGWGIREESGAADFRRHLVTPCTRAGAATLACDHVVKDTERRGRNALGSIHKGNAIDGALIMLENADPFGRGLRGRSHVFITKDRPGQLRSHGKVTRTAGKTYMGEFVVDACYSDLGRPLELRFWAPKDDGPEAVPVDAEGGRDLDDEHVLDTVKAIIGKGKPVNIRTVYGAAGIRKSRVDDALARLTLEGLLDETTGPRNARIFTVPTVPQDQSSEVSS